MYCFLLHWDWCIPKSILLGIEENFDYSSVQWIIYFSLLVSLLYVLLIWFRAGNWFLIQLGRLHQQCITSYNTRYSLFICKIWLHYNFINILYDVTLVFIDLFAFIKHHVWWVVMQKPIRSGVVGHTLMVEEQGRRKVNNGVMLEWHALRADKKNQILS